MRTWQEPFGKDDLSEEERSKVEEDDLMMWRSIMLYIVTSEVRRALPQKFGKNNVWVWSSLLTQRSTSLK